jgi:hypothetical protein
MKFTGTKNFNLIPIGNISFSFDKRTKIGEKQIILNVNEVSILHNTSVKIDAETEKLLHGEMKKHKTDLLTDGDDFFTTTGGKITEIRHRFFSDFLTDEKYKEQIFKLKFG